MRESQDYKVVCFGEILWDILPDKKMPGGAPMNVAYHLNHLHIPTVMISRVGKDSLAEELLEFMSSKDISTKYIQQDDEYPTGKVLATIHGNEVTYEILQPVSWDFIRSSQYLHELVGKAEYFIFGSLVSRNKNSRETLFQLLESASFKVLDINLRQPHYEKKVLEYLLQHADMVKLNASELELLSEWYQLIGTEKEKMLGLQGKFQLNTIVTTRGENGAIVLNDGNFFEHPGFKVMVADTIGSGDAFLAAFLSKFLKSAPLAEAVEYASAMGAFVATQTGACPDYVEEDINNFLKKNKKSDYA